MDTNQKNDTQQMNNGGIPRASVQQPQQPVTDYQGQGGTPPTVTPHGKEAAPVSTQTGEVADYVEPAAHETSPVLEQSVENAGVEVSPNEDELQLKEEHKAAGIQPAKESTPVHVEPQPSFSTPMTLQQAEQAASGKSNHSSTWLGKLVVFVFGKEQNKKEH